MVCILCLVHGLVDIKMHKKLYREAQEQEMSTLILVSILHTSGVSYRLRQSAPIRFGNHFCPRASSTSHSHALRSFAHTSLPNTWRPGKLHSHTLLTISHSHLPCSRTRPEILSGIHLRCSGGTDGTVSYWRDSLRNFQCPPRPVFQIVWFGGELL